MVLRLPFKDYFKVFRTIHNTRGSGHNLLLPKVRTETARKSLYFKQSKLFNNIASEMKDSKSVVIFKTRILELYRSNVFLVTCYLLNIILRFLQQSTTRGEVGTTCCSPKSELRRRWSLFILMDLNFLIILQVKWRILSQLWFLQLVFGIIYIKSFLVIC